jgi:hypothetical protein
MRTPNAVSRHHSVIPLSTVNKVNRGNREIRAYGNNGKGYAGSILHKICWKWIPICPKCHFQRGLQMTVGFGL